MGPEGKIGKEQGKEGYDARPGDSPLPSYSRLAQHLHDHPYLPTSTSGGVKPWVKLAHAALRAHERPGTRSSHLADAAPRREWGRRSQWPGP